MTPKEKKALKDHERHLRNKEANTHRKRAYYSIHKEEYIAKALAWRAKNPEKHKEIQKRHDATPKRKAKEHASRKSARKRNLDHARTISRRKAHRRRGFDSKGFYTEEQLQARIAFWGGRCYLCRIDWNALPTKGDAQSGERYKTIDHVIPLSKGGTNWPANLRPACDRCNSSKRDKMPGIAGRLTSAIDRGSSLG